MQNFQRQVLLICMRSTDFWDGKPKFNGPLYSKVLVKVFEPFCCCNACFACGAAIQSSHCEYVHCSALLCLTAESVLVTCEVLVSKSFHVGPVLIVVSIKTSSSSAVDTWAHMCMTPCCPSMLQGYCNLAKYRITWVYHL
jgi:hypothetical protein